MNSLKLLWHIHFGYATPLMLNNCIYIVRMSMELSVVVVVVVGLMLATDRQRPTTLPNEILA